MTGRRPPFSRRGEQAIQAVQEAALAAAFDAEREAQRLTVAELARRARLSKRGVIYSRKLQGETRLTTILAQAAALGLQLTITATPAPRANTRAE